MRNSLKALAVVVTAAALVYAWPYIKMNVAESAHYTEQDVREYQFYTHDILKKMPRISSRYDFDYVNIAGPATHIYALKFYETENTGVINAWLASMGYTRQSKCEPESECWRAADPKETIYMAKLKSEKGVVVQVVYYLE